MTELETDRSDPVFQDPLDTLADEHATLLGVLAEMERHAQRLPDGAPNVRFWRRALHFHAEFNDKLHHAREEALLFPALEAAGLSPGTGPTAMLRAEHERCRHWRARIEQALAADDRARLQASTFGFLEFERQHILKENQILFPLARQLLQPSAVAMLQSAFATLEDSLDMPLLRGVDASGW